MPGRFMLLNIILFILWEFHTACFEYITPHNSLHNYLPILSHPTLRFLLLIVPGSGACSGTWLTRDHISGGTDSPSAQQPSNASISLGTGGFHVHFLCTVLGFVWLDLSKSCMSCQRCAAYPPLLWPASQELFLLSHSVFEMFFSNNTHRWHTPCLRF